MGESGLNNKGFTLIELLVALLIILVASLGLVHGIMYYEKFTTRAKMKAQATQILENMVSEIAKLPYPGDNDRSILHPYGWSDSTCDDNCEGTGTCCTFENADADNDGTPDFYEAYTGSPDLLNPTQNLNPNFRLKPSSSTENSVCDCNNSNTCPNTGLPICTYKGYSGRNIFVGVNVVEIKDSQSPILSKGRYVSVVVWYFEPFTNELKQMSAVIFKSFQGLK